MTTHARRKVVGEDEEADEADENEALEPYEYADGRTEGQVWFPSVSAPALLVISLIFNVLFVGGFFVVRQKLVECFDVVPTDETPEEAAFRGSSCGENGIWRFDTSLCDCHACWSGDGCDSLDSTCELEVSGGDPLMFEGFWMASAESPHIAQRRAFESAVNIAADFRIGYKGDGEENWYSTSTLETAIRDMHALVGNVDAKEHH